MSFSIQDPRKVLQDGTDTNFSIPEGTIYNQTGVTIDFGANGTNGGANSLVDNIGTTTWAGSGSAIRFYVNAGRPAGGQAENWGGAPTGLVLFLGSGLSTLEQKIDNFISVNNASSSSLVTMVKNGTSSINIFAENGSNLTGSNVVINASGRYDISVNSTDPVRNLTVSRAAGTVEEILISNSGGVKSTTRFFKGLEIDIDGTVDINVSQKEELHLIIDGETDVPTGELEVNGTFNLIGASKVIGSDTDPLYNTILDMPRVSTNSFAGNQATLQNRGTSNFKNIIVRYANPINNQSSGTLQLENFILIPYDTQTTHGSGNLPEFASFGVINFKNGSAFGKMSFLKIAGSTIENFTTYEQDIFQNRDNNSGDDTEVEFSGYITRGARGSIAIYGGARIRLKNSPLGTSLTTGVAFGKDSSDVIIYGIPIYQDININIKNSSGVNVEGATVGWAKVVPSGIPTAIKFWNKTTSAAEDWITGLNSAEDFKFTSSATGDTGTQKIFLGVTFQGETFSFTKGGFGSDAQDMTVRSYLYNRREIDNVPLRSAGVLNIDSVLIPDANVTKTKAQAQAITGISIDHLTQTITIDNALSLSDIFDYSKYDNQLANNVKYPSYTSDTISVNGNTLETNYRIIINQAITQTSKFNYLKTTKDLTFGLNGDTDFLYEFIRGSDLFYAYRYTATTENGTESYNLRYIGIKDTTRSIFIDGDFIGNQNRIFEFAPSLYDSIERDIRGSEVHEENTTRLVGAFPRDDIFNIATEIGIEEIWRTQFNNQSVSASITATSITLIGNWADKTFAQLNFAIHEAFLVYKKANESTQLVDTDFSEVISGQLVIKQNITALAGLTILLDTSLQGLTIPDSNVNFLTSHDFGNITVRTSTKTTGAINGLILGDIIYTQVGSGAITKETATSTIHNLIFNRVDEVKVRIGRNGFDSVLGTISESQPSLIPTFISIPSFPFTAIDGRNTEDYFEFSNNEILFKQATSTASGNLETDEQSEINLLWKWWVNNIDLFGIDGNIIFVDKTNGICNMNYPGGKKISYQQCGERRIIYDKGSGALEQQNSGANSSHETIYFKDVILETDLTKINPRNILDSQILFKNTDGTNSSTAIAASNIIFENPRFRYHFYPLVVQHDLGTTIDVTTTQFYPFNSLKVEISKQTIYVAESGAANKELYVLLEVNNPGSNGQFAEIVVGNAGSTTPITAPFPPTRTIDFYLTHDIHFQIDRTVTDLMKDKQLFITEQVEDKSSIRIANQFRFNGTFYSEMLLPLGRGINVISAGYTQDNVDLYTSRLPQSVLDLFKGSGGGGSTDLLQFFTNLTNQQRTLLLKSKITVYTVGNDYIMGEVVVIVGGVNAGIYDCLYDKTNSQSVVTDTNSTGDKIWFKQTVSVDLSGVDTKLDELKVLDTEIIDKEVEIKADTTDIRRLLLPLTEPGFIKIIMGEIDRGGDRREIGYLAGDGVGTLVESNVSFAEGQESLNRGYVQTNFGSGQDRLELQFNNIPGITQIRSSFTYDNINYTPVFNLIDGKFIANLPGGLQFVNTQPLEIFFPDSTNPNIVPGSLDKKLEEIVQQTTADQFHANLNTSATTIKNTFKAGKGI